MAEQKTEVRESIDDWQMLMFLYNAAIKEVRTKLDIMRDEFQFIYSYNPIEYVKSRIKTAESIVKKLERYGYESTIENMVKYVNDIAGVRVVCSFTSDIYRLAEMIGKQREISVLYVKDYMKHPKQSGYRSFHMMLEVSVQTSKGVIPTKVELQIRTIAMDFWASLEHKLRYKKNIPEQEAALLAAQLTECAQVSAALDIRMQEIRDRIMKASPQ